MTYEQLCRLLEEAALRKERATLSIKGFHHAGVLVPVVYHPDGAQLLFTRRTDAVESHKGQVSFPGGVVEEGDRDITHTALREAEEELGIGAGASASSIHCPCSGRTRRRLRKHSVSRWPSLPRLRMSGRSRGSFSGARTTSGSTTGPPISSGGQRQQSSVAFLAGWA
jgi:8-oxo-dGTP pyrophosphatase MutT (NUDIX family)